MSALTVVVPATNEPPTLERCLAAIERSVVAPDEVVVVRDPGASASAARNRGAERARGDIVVFVDADVEIHPDALGRVRAAFERDPGCAAVFGSYDDRPADRGLVSAFRNLLHHHVHQQGAGRAETFWTGLGAVRRDAFLATGGFDEARYPLPSIEDIELGDRLHRAGATLVLDPTIQGTHLKVWSLRSMVWTDLVHRGIPWVSLQLRTRRLASTLNCGWRHRLAAAVVALVPLALVLSPVAALALAGAFLGLNWSFYALLARQLGPLQAAGGVVLHGLHHAVALAAVPIGVAVTLGAAVAAMRATAVVTAPAVAVVPATAKTAAAAGTRTGE